MAFQSVPDCAEAVIKATCGGKPIANVLGFYKAGGYDLAAVTDLADLIDAAIGTDYIPILHDGVNYVETVVRGLENVNDFEATANANAGLGSLTGAPLPNNVSLCVTLRSGLTGRSARGRFYAMPTNAAQQSGLNTFSSSYALDVEAFLTTIKAGASGIGWTMAIISRWHDNAKRAAGVYFPVTTLGARNFLMDSQRGRLPVGH